MKHFNILRVRGFWVIVALLIPIALLTFTWSAVAERGTLQRVSVPSVHVEAELISPPSSTPAVADQPPAPAVVAAQASTPDARLAPASVGSGASVSCNSVVHFDTSTSGPGAWNDYDCVDHSIFPTGSLTYKEAQYAIALPQELDLSLAVPLVMSTGLDSMNVFAGIFTGLPPTTCVAGSENKDLVISRHAILPNAAPGEYTAVLDSDNMDGFGDMIVACGNPNSGWCATPAAARPDIVCGNYTISDTTEGGPDAITVYHPRYWVSQYAYDGPERVYRIALTQTVRFTFTLHYSGNVNLPYNNYMSYFLLDDTCNQRAVWDNPKPPNPLTIGETGTFTGATTMYTQTQSSHVMEAGTYYLVVDGSHLPYQGDVFLLDVECKRPEMIYLPLVLRNYPPTPTVTVDPPSGPSGTVFHLTGTGFTPNENISHWLMSPSGGQQNFAGFQANSQGGFLLNLTVTGSAGDYSYYALGAQSQYTASVSFQIQ